MNDHISFQTSDTLISVQASALRMVYVKRGKPLKISVLVDRPPGKHLLMTVSTNSLSKHWKFPGFDSPRFAVWLADHICSETTPVEVESMIVVKEKEDGDGKE